MAQHEATHKPRFPQSFHLDEEGNSLVEETMQRGGYGRREKSRMFRDAVKQLNMKLKQEVTA